MLDTPDYLGSQPENDAVVGGWERWSPEAIRARRAAQRFIASAYDFVGRSGRAAAVRTCGEAAVAYSPDGSPLASGRSGVPTAIVHKCGAGHCPTCAREASARNRRTIVERVEELHARAWHPGPVYQRPPRVVVEIDRLTDASADPRASLADLDAWAHARDPRAPHAWPCRCARCLPPDLVGVVPLGAPRFEDEGRGIKLAAAPRAPRAQHDLFMATPAPPRWRRRGWCVYVDPLARRAAQVRTVVGRAQRRPYVLPDVHAAGGMMVWSPVEGARVLASPSRCAPRRRRAEHFRTWAPPRWDAYGARLMTLTQPARPGERLSAALDRLEDALTRLQRSPTWSAYVDAAVVRVEYTWSTPSTRRRRASSSSSTASWWHVHAHAIVWGRFWPQTPGVVGPCARGCRCARCLGVDDESSLLLTWRRALVATGLYGAELSAAGESLARVRREIRSLGHPARGCRWARALDGVRIGGARIETPRGAERLRGESGAAHRRRSKQAFARVLREVVKYAVKPMELSGLPTARVAEVLTSTRHRRMLRCTGLLYGLHLVDGDVESVHNLEGADHARDARGKVAESTAVDRHGRVWSSSSWVWRTDDAARDGRYCALWDLDLAHRARRRLRARAREDDDDNSRRNAA